MYKKPHSKSVEFSQMSLSMTSDCVRAVSGVCTEGGSRAVSDSHTRLLALTVASTPDFGPDYLLLH